ncbi:MAG TPA: prepilin peptidase [Terriglobia bacterium]|nr:prepilin peptidase [Terriglobia bacterium]
MAYLLVLVFGLVLGSFLNVCIFRLPHRASIVRPRSHCPLCKHPVRWYDNIPVLSYVLLRGRCRDCGERISLIYPIVEIMTAGLLLEAFQLLGWGPGFVRDAVLILILIVIVFTDLTERRIPHAVTVPGIVLGLGFSWFVPVDSRPLAALWHLIGIMPPPSVASFAGAVAGAAVGGGLFYLAGEIFYVVRHVQGLGFGDVMLMLMVGVFFGVPLTLLTVLLGSLLAVFVALPFVAFDRRRYWRFHWPYGSFLATAAIYVCLRGEALLGAYLRWSGFIS